MTASAPGAGRPLPGGTLLHPLLLGAVAVLLLNDHVLKAHWPSWWTGKLSDVAGLAMFPLLLQGLWEWASARGVRDFQPSRAVLVACVVLTAVGFSAVKLSVPAADAWRWGLGALQWPARAAWALASGARLPGVVPVVHTLDGTDLFTLPALAVSWVLGWRRCRA
jgi:hypothetical protein